MGRREHYILSTKVRRKLDTGKVTYDQIEETLVQGTITKKEPDEMSDGDQLKLTFVWRNYYLVVKDTRPCFIITAGGGD